MKKFIFLILILFPLTISFAQSNDITISTSPSFPEPGEKVFVEISSFSENIEDSDITWFANGSIVKQGQGVLKISFTAPSEPVKINVQIITPENQEILKEIQVFASSIDLLWEAPDTYTPPFYKGKALPGPESLVKFIAIPSAAKTEQQIKNSNFSWEQNNEPNSKNSGRGKNTFLTSFDPLRNDESVRVFSNSAGIEASAETTLKPFRMSVSVYPLSSGGEPFIARALRSGDIINKEVSFFAAPYGARPKYLGNTSLNYSWNLGGSALSPASRPFLVTLTPGSGQDQNLSINYNIIKSLFDGVSRVFQIKI